MRAASSAPLAALLLLALPCPALGMRLTMEPLDDYDDYEDLHGFQRPEVLLSLEQ